MSRLVNFDFRVYAMACRYLKFMINILFLKICAHNNKTISYCWYYKRTRKLIRSIYYMQIHVVHSNRVTSVLCFRYSKFKLMLYFGRLPLFY